MVQVQTDIDFVTKQKRPAMLQHDRAEKEENGIDFKSGLYP